jgi:hypothetical protein
VLDPSARRFRAKAFPVMLSRPVRHKTCSQHLRMGSSPGTRRDYMCPQFRASNRRPKSNFAHPFAPAQRQNRLHIGHSLTGNLDDVAEQTDGPVRILRKELRKNAEAADLAAARRFYSSITGGYPSPSLKITNLKSDGWCKHNAPRALKRLTQMLRRARNLVKTFMTPKRKGKTMKSREITVQGG